MYGPSGPSGPATAAADKNSQVSVEEAAASQVAGRAVTDTNGPKLRADKASKAAPGETLASSPRTSPAEKALAADKSTDLRASTLPSAADVLANLSALLGNETNRANSEKKASAADSFALLASSMTASSLNSFSTYGANSANSANAFTLSLSTPVNAAEFREALGLQVSLLARNGVQTAELHLNPADMGPVSIQIVMDGNQARVDFGADVAATRKAIEASMPELASALRDAGFTLAGGGVSQHAKSQSQAQDQNNKEARQSASGSRLTASAGSADAALAPTLLRRAPTTLGGVDLFV